MSVSLFDYFGLDVAAGARLSSAPRELTYKPAPQYVRPLTHDTFEPYRVQRIEIPGAHLHATPLVESGALASVPPPMPKYRPMLEPDIITRGLLSLEQIETVIYAGEQHNQLFAMEVETHDGTFAIKKCRGAFLIGDSTGVGKGRCVAAVIRDQFNRGNKRAVWLSRSELLIADARRDWTDIGGQEHDLVRWQQTPVGEPLEFTGILFGTYALLRGRKKNAAIDDTTAASMSKRALRQSREWPRLKQLIDALGPSFDGVIVFDECDALMNAAPKRTEDQMLSPEPSSQGLAALYLQAALPKARVLYVSATAASRPDALAYAQRLQLWGKDGAFPTREEFLRLVSEGGMSALEVICRDLKAQGRLCARTLSYEGVRYQRIVHELDTKQIKQYNSHNRVCRAIEHGFNEEMLRAGIAHRVPGQMEVTGIPGGDVGAKRSQWRGARLYADRQVLISLQMPTLIPFIEARLNEGKAVVIQLTHTNQAALNRALEELEENEDPNLDDLDLSHREKLTAFLKEHYPIGTWESYTEDGKERVAERFTAGGKPMVRPDAVARRDALIDDIASLVYPLPGLDALFQHFGHAKIAEVTGRQKKMVWERGTDGEMHARIRERGANENRREIEAFLNDHKQILIFSEGCGGVGVSFHADIRYKNQRPRAHIFMEMSWRAEGAVQGMGRTHRTGQVCPPLYVFSSTNVDGERRFMSTPARRIAALGALSRGQREAADNGLFRAEDNLEGKYGQLALKKLFEDVKQDTVRGISRQKLYDQTGLDAAKNDHITEKKARGRLTVAGFLNRVLTCDIAADGGFQRKLIEAFIERIDLAIDEAKAAGTYDSGVETFRPDHLTVIARNTINVTPAGAKTELLELAVRQFPRRLTWEQIRLKCEAYAKSLPTPPHFATDREGRIGLYVPVQHRFPNEEPLTRIIGVTGERIIETKGAELMPVLDLPQAEHDWTLAYDSIKMDYSTLTAVTGALTPIWVKLPWANPRILRAQTDAGERLLIRIIRAEDRNAVYEAFGLTPIALAA